MDDAPRIGGAPPLVLRGEAPDGRPGFTEALILPGRGMMLLQVKLRLPSGTLVDALHAPTLEDAAAELNGGPEDFNGNRAFAFGGALLAPFANRIRGRDLPDSREIETIIAGHPARLPRNWGGKAPGAEQYAMHGLILDAPFAVEAATSAAVRGTLDAGDFGGRWPGRWTLHVEWRLEAGALRLAVEARNTGQAPAPIGLGWHPYFALPSGDRLQARLRVPARLRTAVNDYDEVLPTGALLPLAGTPYDMSEPEGRALGELYLDDCFTGLERPDGAVAVEVRDPAANLALHIASPTPQVKAVQVYAPPDKPFVVVEPQFNLADPFGAVWDADVDTGMALVQPGSSVRYDVEVSATALGT